MQQSRLGIASFVLACVVAAGYAGLHIALSLAPTIEVAFWENLGFMIGASLLGVLGLVLGVVGWLRATRLRQRNGFAILGSALGLAVTAWAVAAWIMTFTIPVDTTGA